MLAEFIDLLTDNTLDAQERDNIIARIAKAPDNPNYQWTVGPEQALAVELLFALDDYLVICDTIEDGHTQLQDMFDENFPVFPYPEQDGAAYFAWLDKELARCGSDDGLELLRLDPGLDDRMYLALVDRQKTDRTIHLAQELGLRLFRTHQS